MVSLTYCMVVALYPIGQQTYFYGYLTPNNKVNGPLTDDESLLSIYTYTYKATQKTRPFVALFL